LLKNLSLLSKNILYMSKSKVEYLWLDGYKPTANLRGKTKII
jgi:glutamine synthetase